MQLVQQLQRGHLYVSKIGICLIFFNNIISSTISLDTSFLYIAQKLVTAEVKASSDNDWNLYMLTIQDLTSGPDWLP